jgi:hypothetical protein
VSESEAPKPSDRAFIVGALAEDKGVAVLRQRGEGAPVEAGVIRNVRDGEPIVGELVSLKPTREGSRVCDIEVHVDHTRAGLPLDRTRAGLPLDARPAAADESLKGPTRVNNDAFRDGWDRIFQRRSDLN